MKKIGSIFLFVLLSQFAFADRYPTLFRQTDQTQMNLWVDSVFNTLTSDEKIGQLFMIVAGPDDSYQNTVLKNIQNEKIGGILFSSGNLEEQAKNINLYQKNSRVPLLVSFDGEWGLAMRLKNTPLFPHNMMLGAVRDNELIRLYGEEVGRECRELGVHINFAPVLDVNVNPANPVIGNRSFGEKPQLVAEKGIAYARGLESRNILSVGKHFPGHGDTADDSHKTLPVINHSKARLEDVELYPFQKFIDEGFAGIMTGHLSVPSLDKSTNLATSLSSVIINGLLKKEMGFQGLAFTDALAMKGATGGKYSICVQALLAGNDVLLSPAKPSSEFSEVKDAVAKGIISEKLIEDKCRKVLQYKYIVGLKNYKPIQLSGLKYRINSDYAKWLIQKLNNEAVTLLKNDNDVIPLKKIGDRKIAVISLGEEEKTPFQEHLSLYGNFDYFRLSVSDTQSGTAPVFKKLNEYDVIICGVHNNKLSDLTALQPLTKTKEVHLCFFVSPYSLQKFKQNIQDAKSVTLAYENTEPAQNAAAEILMGGIPALGKLPVRLSGLFELGIGLETEKVRLSYQDPYEEKMAKKSLDKIDNIVKEAIDNKAFPGCQILVAKDGVVIYNRAFGYFDYSKKRPVSTSDIYDLASVTKALATVPAVMKLFDEKKLTLSTKASRFIPELQGTDKSNITIENLLYHESQLPAFLPFYELIIDQDSYSGKLYSTKKDNIFNIQYDTDVYMRSDFRLNSEKVSKTPKKGFQKQIASNLYIKDDFNKEIMQEIANATLRKRSGYLYSDLNFILLKEIVENISGEKFNNFLENNFFSKLGADFTYFLPLGKIDSINIVPTENDLFLRKQLLRGYPHDEAAALMGGVSGNAGLFSNANDMAKILQMMLNDGKYGGEEYLSRNTVKLFTRSKSAISRRGLGFDKPDPTSGKGPTCDLAPMSSFGHTGYTGTCFWVDPDNKLIYIFLSNRVYPSRTNKKLMELNIRTLIQEAIYEAIEN